MSWFGGSKQKDKDKKSSDPFDNSIQSYFQKQQVKIEGYEQLNRLTEECWDKCIRDPSTANGDLNSKEKSCLSQCAFRWIDCVKIVEEQQRSFHSK